MPFWEQSGAESVENKGPPEVLSRVLNSTPRKGVLPIFSSYRSETWLEELIGGSKREESGEAPG